VAEHFTLCLAQPGRPPHTPFPIATAPGSTKWLSISHFAWHNLAALPIPRSPSPRPLVPQSG
jgi:hypothetical protein